uniref:CCHC-type domain-containing protein n=1 Tax=Tanacetum cinerariifolium TaxID=118510 RepID=A0A6L2JLQ4_TANCI|nr:hypothetical protein [Tanacetum cinerariifolium]
MVSFIKLPILKNGEYIFWTMKMEQYLAHTDYALWEVILNGNGEVQMKKDKAGSSRSSSNLQNVAFVSAKSTSSTNELNAAYSVSTATGHSSQAQEQIDQDDLEEMDLKWQVAMLSMRVKRFYKKTGRKLEFNGKEQVSFDQTKVECFNCHRRGHFIRDCKTARNPGNMGRDAGNAGYRGRDNEEEATDFALMAFTSNPSSSSSSNSECKLTGLGYDSQFNKKEVLDVKEEEVIETVFDNCSSDEENSLANDRFKKDRMAKTSVLPNNVGKGTGRRESRPVWNNVQRINYQNKIAPTAVFTRFGRIPVSAAKLKAAASTSATKPVNTARPKQSVNFSNSRSTFYKSHSPMRRSFYNATTHSRINSTEIVNNAGSKAVSVVKGNGVTTVKASSHLQQALKNKGIVNSECSRHMTGNKAYLADYQEINDRGFVAFGSSRGKIIGKGKLKTEKLDFDDVYFVNVLKFNLFSVSQMCDKKNSVLFTETEGLVLSPNFKLLDESQVLLRIPKQSNMRLGHINFKTMNKLVKENIVRGIPSKIFENNHTCVACQKGKQHKATRKNRTLIEAARTMLADSLLLVTFWDEADSTACYVLNRALVTKHHNKTLYELLNGRSPRLDFMRPFGSRVTILNTLDPLGKFEGKADEGFSVGYSVTSKAFRVLNTKTRKVEENLHVRNQTDKNAGPQDTNGNLGTQDNVDAGKEVSDQHYIVLPLWSSISSTYKSLDDKAEDDKPKDDTGSKTVMELVNKDDQAYRDALDTLMSQEKEATDATDSLSKEFEHGCMDQRGAAKAGSTNNFNTVSNLVNAASTSGTFSAGGPSSSRPDAFIPDDTLLYMEPKKVAQAFDDERWVEAMQDELLQFSLQKMDAKSAFLYGTIKEEVYVSQPPGFIDPQFSHKVYKVEKALYGLHQAPRAWYETLSTFLLQNGYRRGIIDKTLFIKTDKDDIILVHVYVDDIIFGSTKKSLCDEFEAMIHKRFQMSSMGELTFFLGLQKPLVKDKEVADVDVHLYRSMIGSLMYLVASRPDIMFAVCACSRFQVTPKLSHLHAVKRIFRYLKGQPKLGLWYPRDSLFHLEVYSDSDYAGANLDRKSTTGGCQFLGKRLISWQCKKQTIVATSTTKAEYVAAAN